MEGKIGGLGRCTRDVRICGSRRVLCIAIRVPSQGCRALQYLIHIYVPMNFTIVRRIDMYSKGKVRPAIVGPGTCLADQNRKQSSQLRRHIQYIVLLRITVYMCGSRLVYICTHMPSSGRAAPRALSHVYDHMGRTAIFNMFGVKRKITVEIIAVSVQKCLILFHLDSPWRAD